ncbi:hypothetical protein A9995_04195 [Erythrobacter sp. QSSC1-22B]|nr:hypothetical protein A9995_04195 [Erythrobacter sp. QSSC1-22B]
MVLLASVPAHSQLEPPGRATGTFAGGWEGEWAGAAAQPTWLLKRRASSGRSGIAKEPIAA